MDILEFVRPELLILIPFLWGIGFLLKRHPNFESWRIPFVLYGVGVVISPLYLIIVIGIEDNIVAGIISGIVQGVLVACAAVGLYEGLKNINHKGDG